MSFTGRRAFSSLFCLSKRAFSQHLLEPSWSRSSILHSKPTGPEQTARYSLEFAEWHNGGGLFHRTARVDPSVFIEVGAIVHQKAVIGADVHIGSGSIVGPSVSIGQSTNIMYNAVLSNCSVGMSCVIHNGSCIGQDGFGFFVDKEGNMMKKPQMLDVRIGDHVEIGANSCIDRGSWRDTVVGDYTKIDNLVQIGHNVVIGKCCMLCGQVGIAGSVTMGDYCTLGGRVAVKDHVTISSKIKKHNNWCSCRDSSLPPSTTATAAFLIPLQQKTAAICCPSTPQVITQPQPHPETSSAEISRKNLSIIRFQHIFISLFRILQQSITRKRFQPSTAAVFTQEQQQSSSWPHFSIQEYQECCVWNLIVFINLVILLSRTSKLMFARGCRDLSPAWIQVQSATQPASLIPPHLASSGSYHLKSGLQQIAV